MAKAEMAEKTATGKANAIPPTSINGVSGNGGTMIAKQTNRM